MPDLKANIRFYLKKNHAGKERAVTIHDLCFELYPLKTNDREIRQTIRELNMEGIPILTSVHPPYGVFYGVTEGEVNEYLGQLGARMKAILERMSAVSKIKAKEFLRGQMEMFGG